MPQLFDVDIEQNTLRDGYATPQNVANPHVFTTAGFDENFLPRVGHNIEAAAENFVNAYAAAQLESVAFDEGITNKQIDDLHAAVAGAIRPMEKADPIYSGGAANVLGSFLEKTPAMAAGLINPALAAAGMYGLSYGENLGEAKEMGLSYDQMQLYAGASALPEAIGAGLPGIGGFGKTAVAQLVSRFATGAGVNVGLDLASNWSRAGILDSFGKHEQADNQRHYDLLQATSSALLGGVFNLGGGHVRDRQRLDDAALHTAVTDHRVTESAPGIPADSASQSAHYRAMNATDEAIASGRAVDVSDHIVPGEHEFIMKTPEQMQTETTQHWHEDLDEKLRDGEITPEEHAAAYDNPPTYEQARAGFDAAEEGEKGSLKDIQDLRRAAMEAFATHNAAVERTLESGTSATQRTKVTDALDSDDYANQLLAEARAAADTLGEHGTEGSAQMHAMINDAETSFRAEMAEHEQYSVAAACALSFGV